MESKLETAEKKVLVDIVKSVQKKGMKGELGDWKEFLTSYDKKFGAHLSDPAKRTPETLIAFLKTFSRQEDLKIIDAILRRHSNQELFELLNDKSVDTPEQRLVQKTLQHPSYSRDYTFAEVDKEWVVINLKKKNRLLKFTKMIAIDCEMVLCEDGTEAVVSVCVVDRDLKVKLNKLVQPSTAIADYRSQITGVYPQDLEGVTCSLAKIQKSLSKMLMDGTILVGHGLHNDLRALKLDYVRVIDTAYIFQHSDGKINRKPPLNTLCKSVLGYEVRKPGAPHNCLDDAMAAMKLVLAKMEKGVDKAIHLIEEPVPESETTKLLIHRISSIVDSQELYRVIPGDFKLELRPRKGDKYSAFAIFENPRDANEAFERLQGKLEKDTYGHPQKLVVFQCSTDTETSIRVRKMALDGPYAPKRALEEAEIKVSKKAKMDREIETKVSKEVKMDPEIKGNAPAMVSERDHLNEIEALKQKLKEKDLELKEKDLEIEALKKQLKQKDLEISVLNKMVSSSLNKKLTK